MYVFKVLFVGVKVCLGGWLYFYVLVVVGRVGVECVLGNMCIEIECDMKLMGVIKLD